MRNLTYLATIFLVVPLYLHAASLEFTAPSKETFVGDAISIPVYVSDVDDSSLLIVQADIVFSEGLWIKSFDIAPGWLPVDDEEYQALDNGRGYIRRTAGFRGNVSGRILFGTIEGIIRDRDHLSLEASDETRILKEGGEQLFRKKSPVILLVTGRPIEGSAPYMLFDIGLTMEEETIRQGDPIGARVSFQNFGSVQTPVDMFFAIIDEQERVVASAEESAVVETESLFTKRFEGLDIPNGRYMLRVVTRYNVDVEDSFSVPFTVSPAKSVTPFFLVAVILLCGIVAVFLWWIGSKYMRKK